MNPIYLAMRAKSFRKFVEDKEAKSPYINALKDELGIDSRDMEMEPLIGSFFSLGNNIKNVGPYKVIKIIRDEDGNPTHAVVKMIEDKSIKNRNYRDEDGEMKRVELGSDEKAMVVPIDDLDKLMSQDFQPPPQPPGGIA
jgi:hypothetical protein